MYNLLIDARAGVWNGDPYELEIARAIREFTEINIKLKYEDFSNESLIELLTFPTLFAYEEREKADASLGLIKDVKIRKTSIKIEYEIPTNLPKISHEEIKRLSWELDIDKWELNRTHWAVKQVNLLQELINAKLIKEEHLNAFPNYINSQKPQEVTTKIREINPEVFHFPDISIDSNLVSVMMPFDKQYYDVYSELVSICKELGLTCKRADNIWNHSVIMQDVAELLFRSQIVIVDFTGKNPNVMYETGIAHTLGRKVIPISQSMDDVPFDLRHHRVLIYEHSIEGLIKMKEILTDRLIALHKIM